MTEFDKVIPPGGVGKVSASLDTSHYRGPIAKSIQVTTNDPAVAPIVLQLKAEIVAEIDVLPSDTPAVRTTVGESKPTDLTLASGDGHPFDVLDVQADPRLTVTVHGEAAEAKSPARRGKKHAVATGASRYVLTIVPKPDLPVGAATANVTLQTDRAKAQTIPLRVLIMVSPRVEVVPPRLVMRPGPNGSIVHAKIRRTGAATVKVVSVESSDPDLTATTTPVAEGSEWDLAVTYTGSPGRGRLDAQITVKTDVPGESAIVVPIVGAL